MFASFESYCAFFFSVLACIILLILFQNKLEALERKYRAKHAKEKATIKEVHINEDRRTAKSA